MNPSATLTSLHLDAGSSGWHTRGSPAATHRPRALATLLSATSSGSSPSCGPLPPASRPVSRMPPGTRGETKRRQETNAVARLGGLDDWCGEADESDMFAIAVAREGESAPRRKRSPGGGGGGYEGKGIEWGGSGDKLRANKTGDSPCLASPVYFASDRKQVRSPDPTLIRETIIGARYPNNTFQPVAKGPMRPLGAQAAHGPGLSTLLTQDHAELRLPLRAPEFLSQFLKQQARLLPPVVQCKGSISGANTDREIGHDKANKGLDTGKISVRKSELGWLSRSVKDEPATVVQSGLASAIYQSVSNSTAHNANDGRPLPKVDHEYLKPLEVWQQQKESRVMVKKRHSIPAAELPRLAPLTRRDGLQTDRRHHQPHNSLGALFNAKASQIFAVIQSGLNEPWQLQVAPSVAPSILTRSRLSKSFTEALSITRQHGGGGTGAGAGAGAGAEAGGDAGENVYSPRQAGGHEAGRACANANTRAGHVRGYPFQVRPAAQGHSSGAAPALHVRNQLPSQLPSAAEGHKGPVAPLRNGASLPLLVPVAGRL